MLNLCSILLYNRHYANDNILSVDQNKYLSKMCNNCIVMIIKYNHWSKCYTLYCSNSIYHYE